MKTQDIIFLIILIFLVFKQNPRLSVVVGIVSLVLSIPLFSFWIFFTAERLTWYAAAFFFLAIVLQIIKSKKKNQ